MVGDRGWRSNQVPKETGDIRNPEGVCGLATGEKSLLTFKGGEGHQGEKMNKLRGGEREGRQKCSQSQASWACGIIHHASSRRDWRPGRFETMV